MALNAIQTSPGAPGLLTMNRGNIGVLTGVVSKAFNYSQIPAGGGAGAVFPPVGDVDLGVTYGPTGADFSGTLLQPATTDVANGISYGAGGTEFTGTLIGGGGDEVSFSSSSN